MRETRKTVCNRDCPDACGIVATVEDGRVVRLDGDPDHPVTRGALCYRTSHFPSVMYGPERLRRPLLRRSIDADFQEVGWDEALDFAARRLVEIRAESGPASILHYRSGGSLGLVMHAVDAFFAHFGPVTTKRGDICSGGGDAAQLADFGDEDSHDLRDLLHSNNIVLWGKNVFVSSPHTIPVLNDARRRGAKITLVDPVHHKTASLADLSLQPRPGGDFALAMAVARVLVERGWTDAASLAACDGVEAFRALVLQRSIADWCNAADVRVDDAVELARRIGVEKPCAILVGWGMARRGHGAAIVRALDALGMITGNVGVPGGGVSYYFKRRGAFDVDAIEGPPPPRRLVEPLLGDEILAAKDPPVRAVWVTAGNPVAMLPGSRTVEHALRTRDFVAVVDPFLTDTARAAHLVLPTTTLLESDDLVGAYGHHWLGVVRPVVAPPDGILSDLEIAQALARRIGGGLDEKMAGDARTWKRRLVSRKLAAAGMTLEDLEAGPRRNPLVPEVLYADRKFPTATGRFQLVASAPAQALDPHRGTPERPLNLMALSTEKAQCSQWTRATPGPAVATVHPDAVPGIADGERAILSTRIGRMTVVVRHDARQRRDVVLVPKGGHLRDGKCANALVPARATDMGEGAAYHDEWGSLSPLSSG